MRPADDISQMTLPGRVVPPRSLSDTARKVPPPVRIPVISAR